MFCANIKVFGIVQGVFFRSFVAEYARELGLAGWVRNTPDGTVEILVEGEEANLKKLIEACQQGPKFAKVENIMVKWEKAEGKFEGFVIQ